MYLTEFRQHMSKVLSHVAETGMEYPLERYTETVAWVVPVKTVSLSIQARSMERVLSKSARLLELAAMDASSDALKDLYLTRAKEARREAEYARLYM